MTTLTIKTDRSDDLYFIRELARRLNLEAEIQEDDNYTSFGKMRSVGDEDTKEDILKALSEGLHEVKQAKEGKIKLKTLDELLDEYKD